MGVSHSWKLLVHVPGAGSFARVQAIFDSTQQRTGPDLYEIFSRCTQQCLDLRSICISQDSTNLVVSPRVSSVILVHDEGESDQQGAIAVSVKPQGMDRRAPGLTFAQSPDLSPTQQFEPDISWQIHTGVSTHLIQAAASIPFAKVIQFISLVESLNTEAWTLSAPSHHMPDGFLSCQGDSQVVLEPLSIKLSGYDARYNKLTTAIQDQVRIWVRSHPSSAFIHWILSDRQVPFLAFRAPLRQSAMRWRHTFARPS